MLAIGTDPNEWWSGEETVKGAWRAQLEATGGFPTTPGDIRGYASGDIGWAAATFTTKLPDGSDKPGRMTAVLVREGKDWKLAQVHVSIGVPNEDILGELPT
jgi:hypothetical protein